MLQNMKFGRFGEKWEDGGERWGNGEIFRRGGKRGYSPLIHIYNIRNRGVVIPSAEMICRRCNNKYHKSDNFSPEE